MRVLGWIFRLITSVIEHWALLPASAHGTYQVLPCGTGKSLSPPTCWLCATGKTQVPENGLSSVWGSISCWIRPSVACGGMLYAHRGSLSTGSGAGMEVQCDLRPRLALGWPLRWLFSSAKRAFSYMVYSWLGYFWNVLLDLRVLGFPQCLDWQKP